MKNFSERKFVFMFIILLPLIMVGVSSYLLSIHSIDVFNKFEKESQEFQKKFYFDYFLESKQNEIDGFKGRVETIYDYLYEKAKLNIKENVETQSIFIKNLYTSLKDKYSKKEILEIIKNSLRKQRFMNGYGYYYIYDKNYNCILLPIASKLEGTNFKNYKDITGQKVVVDMVNGAKKNGEYWSKFYYKSPKSDKIEEKMGYSNYIKGLDVIIGSGLYKSQLESDFINFFGDTHTNKTYLTILLNNKVIVGRKIEFKNLIKKDNYYISKNSEFIILEREIKKYNIKVYMQLDLSILYNGNKVINSKYKILLEDYKENIIYNFILVVVVSLILSILLGYFIIRLLNKYIDKIKELNIKLHNKVEDINEQLLETTELYETIFNLSPSVMALLDENFCYLNINKEYRHKMLNNDGFDNDSEFMGKKIGSFGLEENREQIETLCYEISVNNEFINKEIELYYPNIKPQVFLVSAKKIVISNKLYYILVGEDVTEYKNLLSRYETLNIELEKRVKLEIQKNREQQDIMLMQSRFATMGEMIGMIAHQWRQPLNVIALIGVNIELEIDLEGSISNEELKKHLKKLASTVKHMSQTIDDFKNMLTKESRFREVILQDILKQVLDLISPQLKSHSILVKTTYCEDEVNLFISDSEFKQVLLNIINNSKDEFISGKIENPIIDFECNKIIKDNIEYVKLSISDNAGGIPNDIIDKVFDPYFSTKSKNGTGIGLYMSKMIVEKQHGEIDVENIENGARFNILLPIYNENNREFFEKYAGGGRPNRALK